MSGPKPETRTETQYINKPETRNQKQETQYINKQEIRNPVYQ
jgi:hypothetical protein